MKATAGAKRILVVEDEKAICEVCRRVLTGEGFEVDIAASGDVAQGMLGEKDYGLIIIDVRLPGMNGKQLYRYMSERYPELTDRVIITTGDTVGGNTQAFLKQTGRPFLPKPFTPEELRATVKATLRQVEK